MKKIYFVLSLIALFNLNSNAQTPFASEVIVVNGESFGNNQSNIGSYNILTKTYEVFDSLFTNSVQDILIDDSIAYVSAGTKIFAYDLISKTKIAEAPYAGVSPSKGSLFTDDNNLYVGNWYGQTDSNLYVFDKNTLAFQYAVTEASTECGGGLSLNDTLYIGQKIKGTIDGCAPYGCFTDTMGAILVTDATTGTYVRTIDLGVSGAGIEQIYSEGDFLFAVCTEANKIIKIEIATDSIFEEISLAPFSQSLSLEGTKLYLDMNAKAGYYDLADGSFALSALDLAGTAIAYDPMSETAFTTGTDFFSYGSLNVYNDMNEDTVAIGISPEAIGIFYIENASPIAMNDSFEFVYDENISEYLLDVLANDTDTDGGNLSVSNLSATNVSGAMVSIVGNEVKYEPSAGIATTDQFTYDACDDNGSCTSATVYVKLKSVTPISNIASSTNINIYPNPTTGILNIDSEAKIDVVEVYNVLGSKVKISKETKINLQDLNKGTYFVVVRTKNEVLTTKVTFK